jgi:hypothetical protein
MNEAYRLIFYEDGDFSTLATRYPLATIVCRYVDVLNREVFLRW